MDKKRWGQILSLAVLLPAALVPAGLLAQLLQSFHAWQAAGSDYGTPPALPVLRPGPILRALVSFPEGVTALALTTGAIALLIFCQAGTFRGMGGTRDAARNLIISSSGSHGTAGFMTEQEAKRVFEVTEARKTGQDILGAFPNGRVITLGKDSRLNSNLAAVGTR